MAIVKNHFSCIQAYRTLKKDAKITVREQLMGIFDVKRSRLYDLMRDYYNIPIDEKIAVEQLFISYNIKPEELWKIWQDDSSSMQSSVNEKKKL